MKETPPAKLSSNPSCSAPPKLKSAKTLGWHALNLINRSKQVSAVHDTGVFRYLGGKSKQVCPLPLGWLLLYKFLKEKPENGNQSLLNELPPLYGIGFPTFETISSFNSRGSNSKSSVPNTASRPPFPLQDRSASRILHSMIE